MSLLTDLGHRLSNGVLRGCKLALRPFPYSRRLRIGAWIGRNVLVHVPMAKARALRNIDRVYPDMPAARKTDFLRALGDNTGRVLVEEMMMDQFMADPDRVRMRGPGVAAVDEALAQGRGIILCSAHYGNWEGTRLWMRAQRDTPVAGVYRPHNNPHYNDDFEVGLAHVSPHNFPKGRKGTRDLIRHLRGGGIAAILVDQKQSGAPMIPFLGHPAETTLTSAKLALSMDLLLVPTLTTRAADGETFDSIIGTPIAHSDELTMTRAVNDQLSDWIFENPEQWFWFHRRWR